MIKSCSNCSKQYKTYRPKSIFCSHACYWTHCIGINNQNWKGGKYISNWGYCYIRAPKNHPYKSFNGYIFEHRLVMEKHLGRYLEPTELVHHINGIKTDNRIENLVVITKREHNRIHLDSNISLCNVPTCKNKFVAKGFCDKHYRQYKHKNKWKEYSISTRK